MKRYHRAFIIDAAISKEGVVLTDSSHQSWHVDMTKAGQDFKMWLQSQFFVTANTNVTVFEYEQHGEIPEVENWITAFNPALASQS